MSRMRYCVIKRCEYNAGTENHEIKMFRIPKHTDSKNEWLKIIREVNNDDYDGNGLVCIEHFLPGKIRIRGDRTNLIDNAVPTEFRTEFRLEPENSMRQTENNNNFDDELRKRVLKMRLNFEIKEYKFNDTIKKQSNEISKLKTKLATSQAMADDLKAANKKLKDKLLKSHTSTNITVTGSRLICLCQ